MNTQELKDKFKQRMLECKNHIIDSDSEVSKVWNERRLAFIEEGLALDLSDFTHWMQVDGKMTYQPNEEGLKYIQSLPDWPIWENALVRSEIGNPDVYELYPTICSITLNQADHLAHFMEKTKSNIQETDTIFEVGGGFGCMCRFIYNLGFKRKYIIADLPEYCALIEYYISSTMPEKKILYNEYTDEADIFIFSDISTFIDLIKKQKNEAMFIALWSLSECPISLRENILNVVIEKMDKILMAYQIEWYGYDNQKYFTNLSLVNNDFNWDIFQVPHLNNEHWYICGKRKV